MTIFAEAIHHGQDDRFALNLWQRLDEVQPDVSPHHRRYGQRQEAACGVEML
jgi:hypothetical protein